MFKSTGKLFYRNSNGEYRLTVEIDTELARYYRSLIPKYFHPQIPKWAPHITVVRSGKEIPTKLHAWKKYHLESITFEYDPYIQLGKQYFWLNVCSKRLEQIREELGLPVTSVYTQPPIGFKKYFHCTIANLKF